MKKLRILSFLIVFAMVTLCISFAVAAETSSVVFTASEPDSSGCFTVDMTVYNAKFNVFQFALRYDPATVTPVDASGAATDNFHAFAEAKDDGWMATIGTEIDTESGLIDFTGYVTPGESVAVGAQEVSGVANVGSTGMTVYTFHFKKTSDAAVELEIAAQDGDKPYREYLPTGGALANAGYSLTADFSVELPDSLGQSSQTVVDGVESGNISDDGVLTDTSTRLPVVSAKPESGDKTDIPAVSTDPEYPVEYDELVIVDKQTRMKNTVIMQIGNYAAAIDGYLVHIYPGEKEAVPYIDENDRTMVPVRFVAESLGADVGWEADTQTVVITKDSTTIRLPIGSSTYTVNGVEKQMDTAAVLPDHGRTMVPVRFVAEALGKSVAWDASNRLVIITDVSAPWDLNGKAEAEVTSDVLLITSPLLRDLIG